MGGVRTLPLSPGRVAQRATFSFLTKSQWLIISGAEFQYLGIVDVKGKFVQGLQELKKL